jgi:hypothetical protein
VSRRKGPSPRTYLTGGGAVKPRDPSVPFLAFSECNEAAPQPHYHRIGDAPHLHVCPIHYSNPLLALLKAPPLSNEMGAAVTIEGALASMPPGTEVRVFRQQSSPSFLSWGAGATNAAAPRPEPSPPAAWEGPCVWCTRHAHPHAGWCPTLVTDEQWVDLDRKRLASKVRANRLLSCGPR